MRLINNMFTRRKEETASKEGNIRSSPGKVITTSLEPLPKQGLRE
jgi:hypothetical protein